MQYTADNPTEYMQHLEDDWRKEVLNQVRSMILSNSACAGEVIEYNMLAYKFADSVLFHLNAQRNYVSLYVGNINKIQGGREMLESLDLGKGCIRIKKSVSLQDTNLEGFINRVVDKWKAGNDISC